MEQEKANRNAAAEAAASPGDLRERAREALAADGISQNRAAREIGISASALSQWLAGQYAGDAAAADAAVSAWLDSRRRRGELESRMPTVPEWVDIPSSERIHAVLSWGQLKGEAVMVHGAAGAGKTLACRRYADSAPNVWVATMSPGAARPYGSLRRVAAACGASDRRAVVDLEDAIAARLRGTRGLLIADEAQHMKLAAIESLRNVSDSSGCGLALVGNDRVCETVSDLPQLVSRLGQSLHLPAVAGEDADALARAWGIQGAGALKEARRIASMPGGLRSLSKALPVALAVAGGKAVSAEDLRGAARGRSL